MMVIARDGIFKLDLACQTESMKNRQSPYYGHRLPSEIIGDAVWHC